MKIAFVICLIFLTLPSAFAQKQLVLLKGEKVILRLYPGDEIIWRNKGSKQVLTSYVNNLFEGRIVTHRDTIPFNKIDRLYFRQTSRMNVIGSGLVGAGVLLFTIDFVNHTVLQGNETSLDNGVTTASIAMVAAGLPMALIKKKSQKVNYKYRLMTVSKGSGFYRQDTRGNQLLYSD